MSNETLQKIAGPLLVAAIIGAFSVAFKVTRMEAEIAALQETQRYYHGAR